MRAKVFKAWARYTKAVASARQLFDKRKPLFTAWASYTKAVSKARRLFDARKRVFNGWAQYTRDVREFAADADADADADGTSEQPLSSFETEAAPVPDVAPPASPVLAATTAAATSEAAVSPVVVETPAPTPAPAPAPVAPSPAPTPGPSSTAKSPTSAAGGVLSTPGAVGLSEVIEAPEVSADPAVHSDPLERAGPIMFEKPCPSRLEHSFEYGTCSSPVTFHLHAHEELHLRRIQGCGMLIMHAESTDGATTYADAAIVFDSAANVGVRDIVLSRVFPSLGGITYHFWSSATEPGNGLPLHLAYQDETASPVLQVQSEQHVQ